MRHLKTINELLGLFGKPNPDVTKAEGFIYKLRNEKFEVDQQLRESRHDFFISFDDKTEFVVTQSSKGYGVFEVGKGIRRLNISESISKQIYDIVSTSYRRSKKN